MKVDYLGITVFGSIVAFTAALGTWQMNRYYWKVGLIEERREELFKAPQPVPPLVSANNVDPESLTYHQVMVVGTYEHDKEVYIGPRSPPVDRSLSPHAPPQAQSGYYVHTPLLRSDGSRVLVNRGWVPTQRKGRSSRPETLEVGPVAVAGVIQVGEERSKMSSLVPTSLEKGVFFYRDLRGMGEAAGFTEDKPPLLISAITTDPPSQGLKMKDIDSYLEFHVDPNKHLIYMGTWYTLAFFGIFMTYSRFHVRGVTARPWRNSRSSNDSK